MRMRRKMISLKEVSNIAYVERFPIHEEISIACIESTAYEQKMREKR